jgi:hypothetical protein
MQQIPNLPSDMPTPEMMQASPCHECGTIGCVCVVLGQDGSRVLLCKACTPPDLREQIKNQQHMAVLQTVYNLLSGEGTEEEMLLQVRAIREILTGEKLTNADALSILAVLMHMVGAAAGESIDGLHAGLDEAAERFQALFPDAPTATADEVPPAESQG